MADFQPLFVDPHLEQCVHRLFRNVVFDLNVDCRGLAVIQETFHVLDLDHVVMGLVQASGNAAIDEVFVEEIGPEAASWLPVASKQSLDDFLGV